MGKTLKYTTNAEILSYFINQNPEIASEIDLPVQGESTIEIGKLIVDNQRYKNMFINTVNLIGLTIIKENRWENPWQKFTDKGTLRFGQQIREIVQDIAKVHDYNEFYNNKMKFLETEVPNIYQYIHQLNFQKWYETTINESELRMAFDNEEDGLYKFINNTVANLYETYEYDKYITDKYQICRRILDGTIPSYKISDIENKSARNILSEMKGVSNLIAFKSPNYNPAGVRRATKLDEQYLMIDAQRTALNETEIYATSFFRNDAEVKTNLAMIDTFSEHDEERLTELLGKAFTPFTEEEKTELKTIVGCIIAEDLFMDYYYALEGTPEGKRQTEFINPTTLDRNIFLHVWAVISTSPFANCCVFTTDTPAVTSVEISPAEVTVSAGIPVKLTAIVKTSGFANKSVIWTVESAPGEKENSKVTVDNFGNVNIPSDYSPTNIEDPNPIKIKATSIFDNTKFAEASISVL